jgi:hypothetical protein
MTRPTPIPAPARSGLHNLEHSHDPRTHALRTLRRMRDHDLKVLAVTEGRDYLTEFIRYAREFGVIVLHARGMARGSDQNYLIVRDDAKITERPWVFQAGTGWYTTTGAKMAPMQVLAAGVDGVTYVSGHAPVAAWRPTKGGRKFIGPIRRRIAYIGYMRRMRKVFRRHRWVVMWADWNSTPTAKGRWSPEWLRKASGAVFIRPFRNTGHGEIDFAIAKNAEPVMAHVVNGAPSDHEMVWAYVVFNGGRR